MRYQRQMNIELMRIFSMFLICLWHVNGHYLPLLRADVNHVGDIFAAFTPYITFHVDLFVLITGYFGIRHWTGSIVKTIIPILFYVLVLGAVANFAGTENFDCSRLLLLSRSPWWFMHVYLILLFLSPVLETFLNARKKNVYYMLFITTFINVYLGWFMHNPLYDHHGYDIFNFVNLYVIGHYLHTEGKWVSKFKQNKALLTVLFIVCCLIRYKVQPITSFCWWDYSSPLNIIMASTIYCLFLNFRIPHVCNKAISFLSSSALSVYLITDYSGLYSIIAARLNNCLSLSENWGQGGEFCAILFFVIVIFILCCLIDKVRIKVTKPIENYFIRKFNDYVNND